MLSFLVLSLSSIVYFFRLRREEVRILTLSLACVFSFNWDLNAEIVKILIQGDTQRIMDPNNNKQDNFVAFMAKLLTDPVTHDADFILQMGDIVESDQDNSDRPLQYIVAHKGWQQLNGKVPYVLNLGDNDDFAEYAAVFNDLPEPIWSESDGKNIAYDFAAGGIRWLVISLRFGSSDSENQKAFELIEKNPDKKVILIKHEINLDSGLANQLKKYANVSFILSGNTQSGKKILSGDNGNQIGWIRTCHHNANRDSYFRVLVIDTIKGTVSGSFYSPQYERFWHDPEAPYNDFIKGEPWMWHGFNFISEQADVSNAAHFVSFDMPYSAAPGQQFAARVTYRNTGTHTWPANSDYMLGSPNAIGNEYWGVGTSSIALSRDVHPGEEYTFVVDCVAPRTEGIYNLQLRMFQEEVEWFGGFSEHRRVVVSHNLVSNGSFEHGNDAWHMANGVAVAWHNRRSGDFALRLNRKKGEVEANQTINLNLHTDYHVSFWANSKNIKSGNIVIGFNEAIELVSERSFTVSAGGRSEWVLYKGWFNSGGFTSTTLHIESADLIGVAYLDDFVVTPLFNNGPCIESFPPQVVYENAPYHYRLDATDSDGDRLVYRATYIPPWLTFNAELGILSGTAPAYNGVNCYPVSLSVSDGKKQEVQSFCVSVVADEPYANWQRLHAVRGINEDADDDSYSSLLEFAFGGDPNSNESPDELFMHSPNKSAIDFIFRRNQRTVTYTIGQSEDLINWFDYLTLDDSYGFVGEVCRVSLPVSSDKQFFRLQVNR